jgi:L-ascorbate metabolism protein UlaG (beta-lactamase superfamily)
MQLAAIKQRVHRTTFTRGLVLSALLSTLLGCASQNHVERIVDESSVVNYADVEGYEDRYTNIYDDFRDYPVTCEENCYPASNEITCEKEMENCLFTGQNPSIRLDAGFNITWLGHATFLVSTGSGEQFLIDPVFKQFDWPVNWAFRLAEGFNRNPAAPVNAESISQTDAVLYSHIHYDHFNKADIEALGNKPAYLVPLGFADQFPEGGFSIKEMAWYSSQDIDNTRAHFVPAHHFSNRIWVPFIHEDNNATLWGGWVLENSGKTLFFAGDTGYSPHFKDINERFGPIDICLLPIASYFSEESPRWYRKVHTTPEDAVIAAQELNCKVVIPWGYGNASWKMGDKTSHSALFRLLHMKEQLKTDIPWYVLNEGDSVSF